ncbi:MAG: hypothetical protein PHV05_02860 [Candidatus Riflebacteria bacterium]|nr:hypothetical protein [Candidatus Riflebacteria bacterium]
MKKKGYLLLESLVAVLILGAAVVSLVGSMQASLTFVNYSRNQFQSLLLAESTLEELKQRWAINELSINTTGRWQMLSASSNPPLLNSSFKIQYRAKHHKGGWPEFPHTPAPVWTPTPVPAIPSNSLLIVEVFVVPLNTSSVTEGAKLTALLASRI